MPRNNGPRSGTPGPRLWRADGEKRMARRKPAGSTNGRGRRERLSSVATAIRLLKAFSEDEVEIGISALARRLGLAKSTVHRLAVTLVSEGLLEQNGENGRYQRRLPPFPLPPLRRPRP